MPSTCDLSCLLDGCGDGAAAAGRLIVRPTRGSLVAPAPAVFFGAFALSSRHSWLDGAKSHTPANASCGTPSESCVDTNTSVLCAEISDEIVDLEEDLKAIEICGHDW